MEINSNFKFIRINRNNKQLDLLSNFYFNICKIAFDEHELERYDDWKYELENNFITFFILVLYENNVVGGLAYEIYKKHSCAMITYIAINNNYRGSGLSKKLLNEAIHDIQLLKINIILIEVAVPESNNDINAITRQKIWSKLNFTPTNIIYTLPGYLKWKPYQIAIYNSKHKENISINKKVMFLFLTEYFLHILEDSKDKSEIQIIQNIMNNTIDNTIIANDNKWKNK
jgi:ribosomal protein S18 acetylase RimI-like enzyme